MEDTIFITNQNKGFTLIEILIALSISTIVMIALYQTFNYQQNSYAVQENISEMQQNIRGAILMMTREIREAGCDPTETSNAGILVATAGQLRFTRDIAGNTVTGSHDGDTDDSNEEIAFGFSNSNDVNSNGIADGGGADWSSPQDLGRNSGGGFQPIAENIEAIEFNYILEDGTTTTAPALLSEIRAVQISLLASASTPNKNFLNNMIYRTASGTFWGPFNDNFQRRFSSTTIQCRNLGF
ncbi:prepilin-type N-terminal cleavage/methylation domain-containing protein [Desulfobacula sp.]